MLASPPSLVPGRPRWLWPLAGAVFVATLALVAGILLEQVQTSGREQRLVRAARDSERELAGFLAAGLRSASCAHLADTASAGAFASRARRLLASSPEIAYLHVLNSRGDILWSSEGDAVASGWRGGNPQEFLGAGQGRSRVTDPDDPEEADVFVEMVAAIGSDPPCGAVVLGLSELELARALRNETAGTVAALAGFGLIILGAVASVSRWLARRQGEQIRRRAQAEHLAEIGLLAAGLAHELRNPLNAMRFATDSLLRRASRAEPAALAREMVEISREIGDEVSGLDRLVHAFLSYARPVEDRPEAVDLGALARSALAVAEPEITRAGLTARYEGPEADPIVRLSPGTLRQVLVNLLLNAAQAGGTGQTIVLGIARTPQGCTVTVEDDGPGVPLELRESLFEPFVTGRPEGTGLGLAICRRLVAELGGTIRFEPRAPHGSRFTVTVPAS